ncbi:NAD-dependent epimerase/dehydratase family protein [Aurantibacillus circumpalustris]|uniref:NAD-dependent epimerase/dehydratase family protein n=1 Tax=Aurantibacillus circumpalustris TaxID=3036359 RepID=UPI00295B0D22|nr:SDR family oxidoreductase [Aurantibacillus circumpalustris]
MSTLIIGASGFLGNACFEEFSKSGVTFGTDYINTTNNPIYVDSDFSITEKLIRDNKPNLIINCAGSSNIQKSFEDPERDYQLNTVLVEKLVNALKLNSSDSKFINLSSAAVYGNPKDLPVKESHPTSPLSPYGKNKLLSENILQEYFKKHGVKGLSVRIFSAYGIGLKRQFFYDLSSKLISNPDKITLFGTGNESRDFIYVSDIVKALKVLSDKAEFDAAVINIASGEESVIKTTAELYAKIFDYKGEICFNGEQIAGYPLNWKADISKIQTLGFKREINLEKGMCLYVDWIKKTIKA